MILTSATTLRILRPIMRWNLHSNASDVLGLGPRTAGRLASVGVRTVTELLASQPASVAQRLPGISTETLISWQNEAQLILELPELPVDAARTLAAAGFSSAQRIEHCTPTQLLAELEAAQQRSEGWLTKTALPTVAEASRWISVARETEISRAA